MGINLDCFKDGVGTTGEIGHLVTFALRDALGVVAGGGGVAGAHEARELALLGLVRSPRAPPAALVHHIEERTDRATHCSTTGR